MSIPPKLARPPGHRYVGALGAVLAALAAAGCGDAASLARSAPENTSSPTTIPAPGRGPAVPSTYAGLGARGSSFAGAHLESARGRQPGVPLVSGVALNPAGRVTAYDVQFNDRPSLSDYERLVSAAGVGDLPRDRITVAQGLNCLVYGSPALKRLIGVSYTRVTTAPGKRTARVQSVATPGC